MFSSPCANRKSHVNYTMRKLIPTYKGKNMQEESVMIYWKNLDTHIDYTPIYVTQFINSKSLSANTKVKSYVTELQ